MRRQSPAEKKAECIPADNRIFHQSKTKIRNPRGPITEVSFPFFTSTFRLEINSMPVISFFSPNLAVSTDSSKVSVLSESFSAAIVSLPGLEKQLTMQYFPKNDGFTGEFFSSQYG